MRTWSLVGVSCLLGVSACGGSGTPTAPSAPAAVQAIFLVAPSFDLPVGGGEITIEIATAASPNGGIAANVPITLQASTGTLSASSVRTDGVGRASVTWRGTETAVISAAAGDVKGTATVRVALPPAPVPPTPPQTPQPPPAPPQPQPPLAVEIIQLPAAAEAGKDVEFSAFVFSQDAQPVGPLAYVWDLGDGTSSIAAKPVHRYAADGRYPVTLTVTEPRTGRVATKTRLVFVSLPTGG